MWTTDLLQSFQNTCGIVNHGLKYEIAFEMHKHSQNDIKLPDFRVYFKYLTIKIELDQHKNGHEDK